MSIKVQVNIVAANQLRNRADVQQALLSMARSIADSSTQQAGLSGAEAYQSDVRTGPARATAMVKTTGVLSRIDNARNHRILRNVDRGRR